MADLHDLGHGSAPAHDLAAEQLEKLLHTIPPCPRHGAEHCTDRVAWALGWIALAKLALEAEPTHLAERERLSREIESSRATCRAAVEMFLSWFEHLAEMVGADIARRPVLTFDGSAEEKHALTRHLDAAWSRICEQLAELQAHRMTSTGGAP